MKSLWSTTTRRTKHIQHDARTRLCRDSILRYRCRGRFYADGMHEFLRNVFETRAGACPSALPLRMLSASGTGPSDEDDMVMRRVDAILEVTPVQLVVAYFEHAFEGAVAETFLEASLAVPAVDHPPDVPPPSAARIDPIMEADVTKTGSKIPSSPHDPHDKINEEDPALVLSRVNTMMNDARVTVMQAERAAEEQRLFGLGRRNVPVRDNQ